MAKAIRLTMALMAALAFTAAWAGEESCGPEAPPCATIGAQDDSSMDSSAGSGSGEASSEASSEPQAMDELYQQNLQYEYWAEGG